VVNFQKIPHSALEINHAGRLVVKRLALFVLIFVFSVIDQEKAAS
jgi:hypothetical protein